MGQIDDTRRRGFTLEDLRSQPWVGDDELSAFVRAVKDAYIVPIDHETESRHVQLMVDELRVVEWHPAELQASWLRASWLRASWKRGRVRLAFQLVTVMALGTVFAGGLAVAGTGPNENANDRAVTATTFGGQPISAGVTTSFAGTLLDYITNSTAEGCDFGQGVASIASQGQGGNSAACSQSDGVQTAGGHTPIGSRATGEQHSAGNAAGGAAAQGGTATADERSGGRIGGRSDDDNASVAGDHSAGRAGGAGAQGSPATGAQHAGNAPGSGAENATDNPSVDAPRASPPNH